MKKKLKEELVQLSSAITASRDLENIEELYTLSRELYEKLAVLKFIEEKFNGVELDVSKSELAARFEKVAAPVLNANSLVPETNPHEDDIITPGMETIMGMVSEMSTDIAMEHLFDHFVRPESESTGREPTNGEGSGASLNDRFGSAQPIGLNDRLAFTKHLFGDDAEAFEKALGALAQRTDEASAMAYIENELKPAHGGWTDKGEFESRFRALVAKRFL